MADVYSLRDILITDLEQICTGFIDISEMADGIHLKEDQGEVFGKLPEPHLAVLKIPPGLIDFFKHQVNIRCKSGQLVIPGKPESLIRFMCSSEITHLLGKESQPRKDKPVDHDNNDYAKQRKRAKYDKDKLHRRCQSLYEDIAWLDGFNDRCVRAVDITDEGKPCYITGVDRCDKFRFAAGFFLQVFCDFGWQGCIGRRDNFQQNLAWCGKPVHFTLIDIPAHNNDALRGAGKIS